ncbi:metal ABC transporter permease [Marinobacterium mangrovicola]|uniref:Zinc/manganese transport system permease protein n=1 Tax=Marinobacterium mangrovicola TaxID=1476959 RepID=A0A4R1GKE4_9GAMM|nr:metal ABC transporter permease [Marinobacterium mangrovicola]TCK04772.1 zinc/manganese transport system permease protein [Marinobacterium mangrovicola]
MSADVALLLPPFLAGCLVLLTHLPLGRQVLRRGILFIDLAVAQLAALGGLLAHWLGNHSTQSMQLGGTLLAVSGAVLIGHLARLFPAQREALIGLVYSGAAATLLLLVAADPHGYQYLTRSLSGDVLWVGYRELIPLALLSAILLAAKAWRPNLLDGALFYPLFALLVSLSVPLLGIYLVFTTLIAPALIARTIHPFVGWLIGISGYTLGLLAAWQNDWPTGATLVLTLLLLSACALALSFMLGRWQGSVQCVSGKEQ